MSSDKKNQVLSFGVELECLVYVRRIPFDENDENAPPSLLTREEELKPVFPCPEPRTYQNTEGEIYTMNREAGEVLVQELFRVNGIECEKEIEISQDLPPPAPSPLFPEVYMTPTTGWVAKSDGSISEGNYGVLEQWMIPGYESYSVEINSPILRACDAAYDHVRDVVRLLTDNIHIRVNSSCGFHCHVGNGTRFNREYGWEGAPHDFRTLKRAAMLLWAADPTLAGLHPQERQWNTFSHMTRFDTRLALGRGIASTTRPSSPAPHEPPSDTGKEETTPPSTRPSSPAPHEPPSDTDELDAWRKEEPSSPSTRPSVRVPHEPPSSADEPDAGRERLPILRSLEPDADARFRFELVSTSMRDFPQTQLAEPVVNKTVMDGVAIIHHRSRTPEDVKAFMAHPTLDRVNYNFESLEKHQTVEFREAAASVDPDWVVTWARICVGIFAFCGGADDARFRRVIFRLASAEQTARDGRPHRYDAVELLRDLDLFAEAAFVEDRLVRGGEPGRLEAWYPGRIAFFPGDGARNGLRMLLECSAGGSPRLADLKLYKYDDVESDEGRAVRDIWQALRECPEYADVRKWLDHFLRQLGPPRSEDDIKNEETLQWNPDLSACSWPPSPPVEPNGWD